MRKIGYITGIVLMLIVSCERIVPEYPDEPVVDYQSFGFYISVDELGNKNLVGRLSFDFTDGDGNVGFYSLPDSLAINKPDTVKYNFFLHVHELHGYEYVPIPDEDGGILKYRIPYLDKHPLSGTIDLDIYYPVIVKDTFFYTFYIYDRDFNRSNTDTTDVIELSEIDLEE
ncbi:MAG: hypothetical protein ABFS28_10795 [Bacteroidota bacterium]